jgi:hypothetical protein
MKIDAICLKYWEVLIAKEISPPTCVLSPDWWEFLNILPPNISETWRHIFIYSNQECMVFEIKFISRTTYIFLMYTCEEVNDVSDFWRPTWTIWEVCRLPAYFLTLQPVVDLLLFSTSSVRIPCVAGVHQVRCLFSLTKLFCLFIPLGGC